MANELQLEQLFRACDKRGAGHIGPSEFRELCCSFDIDPVDSDTIFADLDHDCDGQVSLEDFRWGFRDFLTSGSRRSSVQAITGSDVRGMCVVNDETEIERRQCVASSAWSHLVAGVGEDNVNKFLNTR
jgi:hypothetical protein